ncbi:DUF4245 domain-containing protein [Jatrophihabitans sp. DSM 45814]
MTRPLTPSERQRLRTSANLWRGLLVVLVVVGLAVIFAWPRAPHSDGIHVVNVTGPIASARTAAGFTLVVPVALDPKWRPTSTEFDPAGPSSGASFRIGYVSPSGKYAEFLESNDASVAAQYGPLTSDKTVTIDGVSWAGLERSDGRQVLQRSIGPVTVVVTGSADQAELSALAASLH